jgi:AhpD family alkylhydroperoxidase
MTTTQANLSAEQKQLVAVGASVGAGCGSCVTHHLNTGAETGLNGEQLLAAVTSAERVTAEAAVAMGDQARATLGPEVTSPALLSRLEEALASLGAALGANDLTNIDRQLRVAADLGASRTQLGQAIETAHGVQENAARVHLREAERLLDALASVSTTAETELKSDGECGCGEDAEAEQTPSGAKAADPVAPANGTFAGCHSMAARFGSSGTAGAMAGCRQMFEQFMGTSAPAETDKPPTATSAAGSSTKEC